MKMRMPVILSAIIMLCFIITGCGSQPAETAGETGTGQVKDAGYKDGIYDGKSSLTSEGYYGKAKVTIKDSRINTVDFEIYDTVVYKVYGNSKHKDAEELLLDETYSEEVYEEMPLYQKQTENELSGMKLYKQELIKDQDVDTVDAVSGATWSYQLFQETLKNVLKQAKK